jgi:hypothetical protein
MLSFFFELFAFTIRFGARGSAATALVGHSASVTFLSTSYAFLMASPSSATTYDLAVDAIMVTFLTVEATMKKLERWHTILKAS